MSEEITVIVHDNDKVQAVMKKLSKLFRQDGSPSVSFYLNSATVVTKKE